VLACFGRKSKAFTKKNPASINPVIISFEILEIFGA
jgi:hypothetical protein